MTNCEQGNHTYPNDGFKCVHCDHERERGEKCKPVCKYYPTGQCRCAVAEKVDK